PPRLTAQSSTRIRQVLQALLRPRPLRPSHMARLVVGDRARRRRHGARQGYDLQLTRYDEKGWRATFYTTGMEHSPTSATGTGWERTPWHATQRAAWEALKQVETN